MNLWIVEPRDPLIARDGRPAVPGEKISTLPFVYPSVLAGAVRTRLASGRGSFDLDTRFLDELTRIDVNGPVLVALDDAGAVTSWFAPAPYDAVLETVASDDDGVQVRLRRLLPRPLDAEAEEIVDRLPEHKLHPVFIEGNNPPGKPPRAVPRFWTWSAIENWLCGRRPAEVLSADALGITGPVVEERVHLALQLGERVGIDGMLFATSGLRFLDASAGRKRLAARRLGMAFRHADAKVDGRTLSLTSGMMAPLGGERRLATWRSYPDRWPALPKEVRERVVQTRKARLVLATPAIFSSGAIPGWSGEVWPVEGVIRATIAAACVPRPEIISGWDLAASNGPGRASGQPKPTRRMAAAGSVYFVDLEGSPEAIGAWCDDTWLRPVSDQEQDRRDGFGLALIGTWEA